MDNGEVCNTSPLLVTPDDHGVPKVAVGSQTSTRNVVAS